MLIIGPNQAWFSSFTKSKVYYFNSGTITEYRISDNDSIAEGIFYKNAYDEIFVFPKQYTFYSTGFLYTYKFTGQEFQFLRKDCYHSYDENCLSDLIYRCGNDALMLTNFPKLYYFNGSEWVYHSETPETVIPFKIGGVSKDSLVTFCMSWSGIYTYNGVKWRKENGSPWLEPPFGLHTNIEMKFGNVYFTYWDQILGLLGYIIIGKPNQTDTTQKSSR